MWLLSLTPSVPLPPVEYSCFPSIKFLTTKSNTNISQLFFKQNPFQSIFFSSIDVNNNNLRKITSCSRITMVSVSVESDGIGSIDPSCTEIIVVRHGETDWNAIGKMQGQLDVELNEIGRQQAVAVAERLSREPNISAIYSSDLKRALETAEAIASRCGGGLEVIRDKDLRERHLGDLQGHVYQDLAKLSTKAYEAFKSHRSDQEIPGGGESRDQLYNRCTSLVQKIGENHRGQRVIVVSHGGAIRSLFNRAAAKGQHPGKISNTSVGIIQLYDGDLWSIKSWNDASHLKQTEFLESAFGGDASSG
ncbi:phosphoglycerate mutase-like protein 4 isoform X2 [Chenopodium quinoa]|uniref:phosphoglycerate mutase-like protein 4 isoform X2 n=1 Tax=Chenopodium quinoa TaxID=63459 RepID=UPI000B77D3EC|nr:phosphoglycerate mutase-like protein 4 isoform X2 [Chenopodium quinoa]